MAICVDFFDQMSNYLLPLVAMASVVTGMIIGFGYMIGQLLNDQRVTLWAKTELFQLFISVGSVVLLGVIMSAFCSLNIQNIAPLFPLEHSSLPDYSVYDAAEAYLSASARYTHSALKIARYHLGGYQLGQMHSLWRCGQKWESDADQASNFFLCLFGSILGFGGGSGVSVSPEAGYSMISAGVQLSYSTLSFTLLSIMNYRFILEYTYNGFALFLLPLGIFLRAMPFLRGLGSLLMSVSICFLTVYPLVLSIFYLDFVFEGVLATEMDRHYENKSLDGALEWYQLLNPFQVSVHDNIFDDSDRGQEFEIMQYTSSAFIMGVFIPTLALLSTIASIMYLNRYLGVEIDLSRIVQMV